MIIDGYRVVTRKVEDGYTAELPELPGCVAHGDTEQTAVVELVENKKVWLESRRDAMLGIPSASVPPPPPNEVDVYLLTATLKLTDFQAQVVGTILEALRTKWGVRNGADWEVETRFYSSFKL